jgi:hypothetical protein
MHLPISLGSWPPPAAFAVLDISNGTGKRVSYRIHPSTTLADLLTPLFVANPFLAMRATLLWWLGDEFENGLPHGWQSWLRWWAVDSFFPVSLF